MSKQTHTKPVTVNIEKLNPVQWHWSLQGGYGEDYQSLGNYDQDTVHDAVAAHAATLDTGSKGSFLIDFPVPDPQLVREDNYKRAFADLKRFTEDVDRALKGLCEAEEAGFISHETPRAIVFQVIDIDRWCGTNGAPKDYRDHVLEIALDAYLDKLIPSQEEY